MALKDRFILHPEIRNQNTSLAPATCTAAILPWLAGIARPQASAKFMAGILRWLAGIAWLPQDARLDSSPGWLESPGLGGVPGWKPPLAGWVARPQQNARLESSPGWLESFGLSKIHGWNVPLAG